MSQNSGSKSHRSRRRFLRAVTAGSAVGLAGCTGLSGDSGGSETGTTSGQSTGGGTAGSQSGDGGTTNLVFWHQESVPHRVETFKRFIDKFNQQHNGIQVSQQPQNWNNVFGKLTSALDAGNEPDFMFSLPAFTMQFQARDALVDVSSLVEELNEQYSFLEGTRTQFTYDEGTWGIPMWDMVFLNHFRSDTLGSMDAWPPKNWEEWFTAVSNFTNGDENKYGIVLPANKNLWTTEDLYTLMINADAYVYGPDGKIMFDTKETVKTLDFYKRMFNQASPPGATNWGWAEWERSLLQETAHSTIGFSSWIRRLVDTDLAESFGAMQQPVPSGGQKGSVHYVNDIMVFNEEKLDAIGTFVKWLHQQENYGSFLANLEPTLYLPVTKTGKQADSYWTHELISKYEDMVRTQFEALPNASLYGFRDLHVQNDLYIPSVGKLEGSHVLAEIVQQLVVNDRSPQEAAKWGQNRLQEVLGVEKSSEL